MKDIPGYFQFLIKHIIKIENEILERMYGSLFANTIGFYLFKIRFYYF